jgi:hypothetical protein
VSNLVFPLSTYGGYVKSSEMISSVRIDESASGKEARSSWWSVPRWRYQIAFDVLRRDARADLQQLVNHFARHFGQLDSFLLLDPEDNAASAHGFGVGDGSTTTFQLQRSLLGSKTDVLGGPWPVLSTPRTNLALWSQDLTQATWTKTASSAALTTTLAPDGTATACKLTDTAATSTHLASQPVTLTSGVTYTLSAWVKAAGRSQVALYAQGTTFGALFDLTALTGAALAGAVTPAAPVAHPTLAGYYRCAFTFTATATGATTFQANLASGGAVSYLGDGSSGAIVWGVQFEAGTAATSYIATTSAALISTPSYWPSYADGFEPVFDFGPAPVISVAGVAKVQTTDYTLSTSNYGGADASLSVGQVKFVAAPASGAALTWSGSFYKRVRFESPSMSLERIGLNFWRGEMSLLSVKP